MIVIIFRFHAVFSGWFCRSSFSRSNNLGLIIVSVKNIFQWVGSRRCIANVRRFSADVVVSAVPYDPYENLPPTRGLFAAGWVRWADSKALGGHAT